MASIYQLKPAFQSLLRPITRFLAGIGVTANQVTVLAFLISCGTGVAIALNLDHPGVFVLLPFVLFFRMALNAVDGMLAREHGMKSHLGAFLNELGDIFSDIGLYAPFAFYEHISSRLLILFLFLAVATEYAGVTALMIGAGRNYKGPFGKSDRAFAFGLISLLLFFGVPAGTWLDWSIAVMILLSVVTIVNRVRSSILEVSQ